MEYDISGGLIIVCALTCVVIVALLADAIKARSGAAAKNAALVEMTRQRDDWKQKAERLIDAALVRAGAIHQPTMETVTPPDRVKAGLAALTSALSVTEIDSAKSRKVAS